MRQMQLDVQLFGPDGELLDELWRKLLWAARCRLQG